MSIAQTWPALGVSEPDMAALQARLALVATVALAAVAPFELREPVLRLPWQALSNLELVLALGGGLWALSLLASRCRLPLRAPLLLPLVTGAVVAWLAAWLAPIARTNALHMAARVTAAYALVVMTASAVQDRESLRRVAQVIVASCLVVAILAVAEFLRVSWALDWLRIFRPGVTVVGAQVRAGGSLQYPTIAALVLEIGLAFGLGLFVAACDEGRHRDAALWFVALAVIGEGVVVSYTRAGLVGMVVALSLVLGIRRRSRPADVVVPTALAALAVIVAGLFVGSRSFETTALRLTTEEQQAWYRASLAVPSSLSLRTGETTQVPVQVLNTGRLRWDSGADPPIKLSYHWLTEDGGRVVSFEGARTSFDVVVEPGATARVMAHVRAPRQPGQYRLAWDLVQEHRLWFSSEPGAEPAMTVASVAGAGVGPVGPTTTLSLPQPVVRPGRLALWSAAARMLRQHPWFGIGPDNFRLKYGEVLGLLRADDRVHSNNMYIEVAVGTGLVGAAAFLWLGVVCATCWRRAARAVVRGGWPEALGPLAAGAAIAVHGLFDSFASFTPTYVVMAVTLGAGLASAQLLEDGSDAHRV